MEFLRSFTLMGYIDLTSVVLSNSPSCPHNLLPGRVIVKRNIKELEESGREDLTKVF